MFEVLFTKLYVMFSLKLISISDHYRNSLWGSCSRCNREKITPILFIRELC